MQQPLSRSDYVLERSEDEMRRLVLQDQLLGPITDALLRAAGIADGMRVLDLGSGTGAVALRVAEMVGPHGSVLGVDIDPASVGAAGRHAAEAGASNVRFVLGDLAAAKLSGPFDAVVGRYVLMHLPDPVAVLARVREHLNPGAVVAFLEPQLARWLSEPESPSLEQVQGVRDRMQAHMRARRYLGLDLRRAFLRAGLPDPHLTAQALVGGGPGWPGFRYVEQTVRALLPAWTRLGIEGAGQIVPDGLAGRIEREVGDEGSLLLDPLIGAWTRIPTDPASGGGSGSGGGPSV